MTVVSQSKRLENALRGCAEAGVSDTVDLWPAVKERATGTRAGAEAGEGTIAGNGARRRFRFPRLVPNTPLGWTLAVVSVLILGVSLYAAAGSVGALYWRGVPGTVEPGSDKEVDQRLGTKLDENLSVLREELNVTKARDGVRLTLEWAYAEQGYVAVGLHTQRLEGSRKTRQDDDILFQPSLWDDTVGNEAEFSPYTRITDASGQDFDTVGGGTLLGPDREEADATFDAPEGLEPGRKHRFRLEVPLIEEFRMGSSVDEPIGKPFAFDFKVPVRPSGPDHRSRPEGEGQRDHAYAGSRGRLPCHAAGGGLFRAPGQRAPVDAAAKGRGFLSGGGRRYAATRRRLLDARDARSDRGTDLGGGLEPRRDAQRSRSDPFGQHKPQDDPWPLDLRVRRAVEANRP